MSPLSNLPGPWRWEKRGENWWRIHDRLRIEDGPHPEPPVPHYAGALVGGPEVIDVCCCAKHAGANICPDCPRHGRGE